MRDLSELIADRNHLVFAAGLLKEYPQDAGPHEDAIKFAKRQRVEPRPLAQRQPGQTSYSGTPAVVRAMSEPFDVVGRPTRWRGLDWHAFGVCAILQ